MNPHQWKMSLVCLLLAISVERHDASAAGTETLIGIVGKDFVLLAADSVVHQSITVAASPVDKIASIGNFGAAAAAGDAADADRLVGILRAHAAIREYETSLGADVDYVQAGGVVEHIGVHAGLSVDALAQLARGQIASQLRSRTPLRVCLLLGGMMQGSGAGNNELLASDRQNLVFVNDNNQLGSSSTITEDGSFDSELVQQQVREAVASAKLPAAATAVRQQDPDASSTNALQPKLFWLDEYGSLQPILYGAHGYASNLLLSILDQGYRRNMTRQEAVALVRTCFAQLQTRYLVHAPQPPCIKCIDATGCHLLPL